MNPDIKAQWLQALRSGKYRQGTGSLKSKSGSYCCLGVLCDLASREGIVSEERRYDGLPLFRSTTNRSDENDLTLPGAVAEWAGLRQTAPTVMDKGLAGLNDGGMSFAEIADLIEEHL